MLKNKEILLASSNKGKIKEFKKIFNDFKIISQEEAEKAVKTLIQYIGEDPEREGLIETPKRVIKSFNEFYAGYGEDLSLIHISEPTRQERSA